MNTNALTEKDKYRDEIIQAMVFVERSYHTEQLETRGCHKSYNFHCASENQSFSCKTSASPHSLSGFATNVDERSEESGDNFSRMSEESIRDVICSWMFEVTDYCLFDRETIYVGMFFFERYNDTTCQTPWDGNKFSSKIHQMQLISLTSLYMAVKIHNKKSQPLMKLFVSISRGKFDAPQIEKMEMDILSALRWKVHPPTPQAIMYHFLKCLIIERNEKKCALQVIHEVTNYIIEMTLRFRWHELQQYGMRASTIAYASTLIALKGVKCDVMTQINVSNFNDHIHGLLASSDAGGQNLNVALDLITDIIFEDFSDYNRGVEEILSSLDKDRKFYEPDASFIWSNQGVRGDEVTTPRTSNTADKEGIIFSTPLLLM